MPVKGKKAEPASTGRIRYSDEQRQHVINYIKQGKTAGDISKLTKMSVANIGLIKRKAGLAKARNTGGKHVDIPKSAKEQIEEIDREIGQLQEKRTGLKHKLETELADLQALINSL